LVENAGHQIEGIKPRGGAAASLSQKRKALRRPAQAQLSNRLPIYGGEVLEQGQQHIGALGESKCSARLVREPEENIDGIPVADYRASQKRSRNRFPFGEKCANRDLRWFSALIIPGWVVASTALVIFDRIRDP